jgi:hypothetical protein
LLFFSHLIGFAVYFAMLIGYEIGQYLESVKNRTPGTRLLITASQEQKVWSIVAQALLPLAIFFAFGPPVGAVSENEYGGLLRKLELLYGMLPYLMPPYLWTVDRVMYVLLPVALGLLLVVREAIVPRIMLWPLLALLVVFFAMPYKLFSGYGADHRLLPALGLLLAGSIRWRGDNGQGGKLEMGGRFAGPPSLPAKLHLRRWGRLVTTFLLFGLVAARAFAVTLEWRRADIEYAQYRRAFEMLEDGTKLYYAFGHAENAKHGVRPRYSIACLALATKHVYVPYLFTDKSNPGINLRYMAPYERVQYLSLGPRLEYRRSPDWDAILPEYDYFLLGDAHFFAASPPEELVPVYAGTGFALYRKSTKNP